MPVGGNYSLVIDEGVRVSIPTARASLICGGNTSIENIRLSLEPTVHSRNGCLENNIQAVQRPAPPILSYATNVKKKLSFGAREFKCRSLERFFQTKRVNAKIEVLLKNECTGIVHPITSYARNVKGKYLRVDGER